MQKFKTTSQYTAVIAGTFLLTVLTIGRSAAADIIDEWKNVKAPASPPELKTVTVDPKTTALLILDIMKTNCGVRPRCGATVPNIKKLHDQARKANMMVFYTMVGDNPTPAGMVDGGFAPREGEWVEQRGPDKFLNSPLDERLKAKGIKTVIVCGTAAQGAVVGAGSGAAQRGYKVIVPVDCMSAEDPYMEQYAAWHMYKGGPTAITSATTLTRASMIKF